MWSRFRPLPVHGDVGMYMENEFLNELYLIIKKQSLNKDPVYAFMKHDYPAHYPTRAE